MTQPRSRALSAPTPTLIKQPQPQPQPKAKAKAMEQPQIVIPPGVTEALERFPPLPKPNPGNTQRRRYREKERPSRTVDKGFFTTMQNLKLFGRIAYKEVFDVDRTSSSEEDDAVTAVPNLSNDPLSPVDQDEGASTDEQQHVTASLEQLDKLTHQVDDLLVTEMEKVKLLPPKEQEKVLLAVTGLLQHSQGQKVDDPDVLDLLSAVHQIAREHGAAPSFDVPSHRMKDMMHSAMQLAELKHLQEIIRDPSFNPDDPLWKKFLVRWPLNFLTTFATVGMTVLLWTFIRSLIGNAIKSAYPDLAVAVGMNATESSNSTLPGHSTLPPQKQGGAGWGAATAVMVMVPQLFNLVALVRDGRNGSAPAHTQVARLAQLALCVTALGIGFSMPPTQAQGLAAAWTVATCADVLKGLLYSFGRDFTNYYWPKIRPNAETLTPKAVVQDALVYFTTQTLFGLAVGYLTNIHANITLHLPFFGTDAAGVDFGPPAAIALVNSVVETIDDVSLAYFMRAGDKKKFIEDLLAENEDGIRTIHRRKEEFIKKKLPDILASRGGLAKVYEPDDDEGWREDLSTLDDDEAKELERAWEKDARRYVKEHLRGLAMKFPTGKQTKEKVTDCRRTVDFLFNGRLATNRACAMGTAFFFASTVLDAMAHPEDPTFDRATQALAAATTIVMVYVPGILACNQRGFANPQPADMTYWQAFKYFMGFMTAKDVEKEREDADLVRVGSEAEAEAIDDEAIDDDHRAKLLAEGSSISDPPPPKTIPGSPPNIASE